LMKQNAALESVVQNYLHFQLGIPHHAAISAYISADLYLFNV